MRGDPVAPSERERVNILLVDDRPGNLLSLSGVLEQPDYNLVLAESGPEALRHVLRTDFAVILLDVAMPEMDGFEVATLLKRREQYKHIPIIFVTASVQQIEWIFKAYSIGAVDFLHKPVDPDAVRAKVKVFVELYLQRRQIERQVELLRESERRQRELEIAHLQHESDRRYRSLADAIPHVVWTADSEGRIASLNRRWTEATGLEEAPSLGDRWRDAVHADDRRALEERWEQGIRLGRGFQVEFRLRQADRSYRWHAAHAIPERDTAGGLVRWLGTFTDVDERRRAHDETRAAVAMRDEFLSIASHELRTPLTSLQLHLESLYRQLPRLPADLLDGKLRTKVEASVKQAGRLATLVDGLLDVTRIRVGQLELKPEEFDFAASVRDVVERLREDATKAGCELHLHLPHGEVRGAWDRLRIEQVVTNLLSNALKYAPGKPVDVEVRKEGQVARLAIQDRGIGIEPQKATRIFERFERAVPGRHYAGLGLGLYIVRQIVEAHAGTVEVASTPGEGSTFEVVLPLRPAIPAPDHAEDDDEPGRQPPGREAHAP